MGCSWLALVNVGLSLRGRFELLSVQAAVAPLLVSYAIYLASGTFLFRCGSCQLLARSYSCFGSPPGMDLLLLSITCMAFQFSIYYVPLAFDKSFTVGESITMSSVFSLLSTSAILPLLRRHLPWVLQLHTPTPPALLSFEKHSVAGQNIVLTGIFTGVFLRIGLRHDAYYLISKRTIYTFYTIVALSFIGGYFWVWSSVEREPFSWLSSLVASGRFYSLHLTFSSTPSNPTGDENPSLFSLSFSPLGYQMVVFDFSTSRRLLLILFWAVSLLCFIYFAPSPRDSVRHLSPTKLRFFQSFMLPKIIVRKYYHFVAVLVFVPAIMFEVDQ